MRLGLSPKHVLGGRVWRSEGIAVLTFGSPVKWSFQFLIHHATGLLNLLNNDPSLLNLLSHEINRSLEDKTFGASLALQARY